MVPVVSQLEACDVSGIRRPNGRVSALRDLFALLGDLMIDGGDLRLALDRPWGCNAYGCEPVPAPDVLSFASSTASPISERAYARAELAREKLIHASIGLGLDEALDLRTEAMRQELKAHLQLPDDIGIVFSPSGTDSQLHALALARSWLGDALTTIVTASDQTGSGAPATARGHHFSSKTASGALVQKDAPIIGLAGDGVALPLLDSASLTPREDHDEAVLSAIEAAIARDHAVMVQIMDSSKLGWHAPDRACLDEIARRWPDRVQVVVDACQMRLSRRRLRAYLARGYMVLITGSKYFGGPAFSGALLVPGCLARALEGGAPLAAGLFDYVGRSDWPMHWTALRARSARRPNFGQWLRWEAALEEIEAYFRVPAPFRSLAVRELGGAIESLLLSPVLRPVRTGAADADVDDEEFCHPTIFPFVLQRDGRLLGADDCQLLYRALRTDLSGTFGGSASDRDIAARRCLIGQPVRVALPDTPPAAMLRLCIGARQVTETWSADAATARRNLDDEIGRLAAVVAKIELLVSAASSVDLRKACDAV
jgi:hypothetical protein